MAKRDTTTCRLLKELLFEKQQFKCALTGLSLEPETASLDHKVPKRLGGENNIENLQWVHTVANRMKGSLGMDEFNEWMRLILTHQGYAVTKTIK